MKAAAVKKAGNPFNEMKKRSSSSETLQHNHDMMKRDKEVLEDDNDLEDDDDDDDGEDFRKYWVDYDAFGYDKRALGSMRKRQQKPSNNDILIR